MNNLRSDRDLGFQPSMGGIFIAQGKTTKECRPGKERTKVNRPRKWVIQGTNLLSDGVGFTIETFQEADPVLSERGQRIDHLHLAANFHKLNRVC